MTDTAGPEMVEDCVDSAGGKVADGGRDVGAVVDRDDAELAQPVVVARGGCADHAYPGEAGQLRQCRADAAVGAVYRDRLAGSDPGLAVQHLPGGDAGNHNGFRLDRVQPGGHRQQVGGLDHRDQVIAGMTTLLDAFTEADPPTAPVFKPAAALEKHLAAHRQWAADHAAPPAALRRALTFWTRLHGVVSLEVAGHFTGMNFDPGLLYTTEAYAATTTT